jgi:impB/mucB/samB family C-terminal domain
VSVFRFFVVDLFVPLFLERLTPTSVAVSLGLGSSRDPEGASSYYPATARKSVSKERTFRNTTDPDVIRKKLSALCVGVCEAMCELGDQGLRGGRCVTLKIKMSNFEVRNRSETVPHIVPHIHPAPDGGGYTSDPSALISVILACFDNEIPLPLPVRLIGVKVSNLQVREPKLFV